MALRGGTAFIILAAAGCRAAEPPRPAGAPGTPRAVRTAEVRVAARGGASAPATIVARSQAVLSARTPGTVTALPFREGDRFAAGAVLVRLDARALVAAQAAAVADLTVAEADRARMESLRARDAATPREAELAGAHAEAARAALAAAREAVAYAELRAPFAGRVAARPANVGDLVTPGTPLLEIEGVDGFELRASLGAAEAAAFAPGSRVQAVVDGLSPATPPNGGIAAPLTGTVRSVSAAGDPLTHRFELRADLPALAGLRSGLFARLALPAEPGDERLVVPGSAVFSRGGLTGVYVLDGGRARLRWVAAGAATAGEAEVRAGLVAGERVVLDPAGLEDGAAAVEAR